MIFTSNLFKIGEANLNGRIYTEDTALDIISQFNKFPDLFGAIRSNGSFGISLDDISHKVTNLIIQDCSLVATVETLNTRQGKLLESMLNDQPNDYVLRPRGIGYTTDSGIVTAYTILSIDVLPKDMAS